MSAEENQNKLIIKGLPFETTMVDLVNFLGLQGNGDIVELVHWHDNPERCKGHAFVNCRSSEEAESIKRSSGQTIEAGGNSRVVKIEAFRPKQKKGRPQNRVQSGKVEDKYVVDDDTRREVYVSNLSFNAKREDFERVFSQFGVIEQITIPKIYSSGRPKGFAFVRFSTEQERDAACENLNETTFLGRTIGVRENKGKANIRRPRNKEPVDRSIARPDNCTTIYVGNLPWSAEENDLQDVFQEYGSIKRTKVVRKSWTNKSRGFGYVEFNEDGGEAAVERAVGKGQDVNGGVYMEGRKLRIDYAEPKTEGTN